MIVPAMRRAALLAALVLPLALFPSPVVAQGSPYVPIGDPAYALVDALLARGGLPTLPVLERPYTVRALREAIVCTDTAWLAPAHRRWLVQLSRRLDRLDVSRPDSGGSPGRARAALLVQAGAWGESSAERDLLRGDDASGARPFAYARVAIAGGPAVVVGGVLADQRLKYDPDFTGFRDRSTTARTEEGYVAGQWRWAELFFGRQRRSWGPMGADGLLLGSAAYTYDHGAATFGDERLHLNAVIARLDPYVAGADSGTFQRYFSAHRLAGRLGPLEGALSETVVFGGVARGFDWAYLNPLSVFQLAQFNEAGSSGNTAMGAELAWRTAHRGIYGAQFLLDDIQVDEGEDVGFAEPPSLGLTLNAEGIPTRTPHRLFAQYTRISNLTYRTPQPWEAYGVNGVSLGRDASDYDELRVGVDLALPVPGAWRVALIRRRQGEGDWRLPYPAREDFPTTPEFLSGVVQRTTRAALVGAASLGALELSADLGVNRVANVRHEAGRRATEFEGRVRAAVTVGGIALLR